MLQMNKVKRAIIIFILGVTYSFMYVLPYMKYSFYDQMIAAMGCTNEQLGALMTCYGITQVISFFPGGWVGDKCKLKPVLLISVFAHSALSFLFVFTYQSYTMALIIWALMGVTGGFAFYPALYKGVRILSSKEEEGRVFGVFDAVMGCASLIASFVVLGVMSAVGSGDLVVGFKSACITMAVMSLISGIAVLFLVPNIDAPAEENKEKVSLKDYIAACKIPGTWVMSIFVFCYVTLSAVISYMTPYCTSVLGMTAAVAATVGTIRAYGTRVVGAPFNGFLADKVYRSTVISQLIAFIACGATLVAILMFPTGSSSLVIAFVLILMGMAVYMIKGTMFSVQSEVGIPIRVSSTAIGLASAIGFIPDIFTHVMFGKWLDTYGDAGYTRILIYSVCMCVLGLIAAAIGMYERKKNIRKGVVSENS